MGYFLKLHPEEINALSHLASLWYQESHMDIPHEAVIDEAEMTVIVNGQFTECYTFDQLYNSSVG